MSWPYRRARWLVLLVALGCAPSASGPPAELPDPAWSAVADLDGDGAPEAVAGWLDAAGRAGVLAVTHGGRRWASGIYPMWKARTGDLDADGRAEVVLGIWSRRRRHAEPEPHRCVWVLGWDGTALVERWRGSALARPLIDFEVEPGEHPAAPALLVSHERGEAGCVRARYRWTGFGFAGVDRRPASCDPAPREGRQRSPGPKM